MSKQFYTYTPSAFNGHIHAILPHDVKAVCGADGVTFNVDFGYLFSFNAEHNEYSRKHWPSNRVVDCKNPLTCPKCIAKIEKNKPRETQRV